VTKVALFVPVEEVGDRRRPVAVRLETQVERKIEAQCRSNVGGEAARVITVHVFLSEDVVARRVGELGTRDPIAVVPAVRGRDHVGGIDLECARTFVGVLQGQRVDPVAVVVDVIVLREHRARHGVHVEVPPMLSVSRAQNEVPDQAHLAGLAGQVHELCGNRIQCDSAVTDAYRLGWATEPLERAQGLADAEPEMLRRTLDGLDRREEGMRDVDGAGEAGHEAVAQTDHPTVGGGGNTDVGVEELDSPEALTQV
jgi:hypothetical protein